MLHTNDLDFTSGSRLQLSTIRKETLALLKLSNLTNDNEFTLIISIFASDENIIFKGSRVWYQVASTAVLGGSCRVIHGILKPHIKTATISIMIFTIFRGCI